MSEITHRQIDQKRSSLHQEILNWLTPIEYASQHSDYSNRRQPGTGEWLLQSKPFQEWLDQPKQTMFCPGIPGAGKTILASAVINHVFDKFPDADSTGVAYIYGNFRRQGDQRPVDLLRSLLKQFLQQQPSIPREVLDAYEASKRKGHPAIEDISRLLVYAVRCFKRCFIVIDALDECRVQDPACTGLLSELLRIQGQSQMNLFLTSRFIPEIMEHFKESTGTLSVTIEARVDDVQKYLKGRMTQLPSFVARNEALQREIVMEISQCIDGMYLP